MNRPRADRGPRLLAAGLAAAVQQIAGVEAEVLQPLSNEGHGPEALPPPCESAGRRGAGRALHRPLAAGAAPSPPARSPCERPNTGLVCGVNLPVLLDFVFHRDLPLAGAGRAAGGEGARRDLGSLYRGGGAMPIVLFRVDERLIHGQVVVGWGGAPPRCSASWWSTTSSAGAPGSRSSTAWACPPTWRRRSSPSRRRGSACPSGVRARSASSSSSATWTPSPASPTPGCSATER